MAKRLTENDIRRIFREEVEREKTLKEVSPEAGRTYNRMVKNGSLLTVTDPYTGRNSVVWPTTDWTPFIKKVIDTYWEVVEEDLND